MTERLPHAALLVLLSACAMQPPEQKPAPNVVLIAVDDLNDWVNTDEFVDVVRLDSFVAKANQGLL